MPVREETRVVNLRLTPHLATPERTFFADYVSVDQGRDGVIVIFGKYEPPAFKTPEQKAKLGSAVEVSFPFGQFYNQLYKSLVTPIEEGKPTFRQTVEQNVTNLHYERISAMERPLPPERFACVRANAALISIFEDDCAADFYHVDAISMQALIAGTARGELKGLVRFVMGPSILLYLIDRCIETAVQLHERMPDIDKLSQTETRALHG